MVYFSFFILCSLIFAYLAEQASKKVCLFSYATQNKNEKLYYFSPKNQKRFSKICLFISILSLIMLTGLRAESVGIDTKNYYKQFTLIMSGSEFVSIKEVAFAVITKAILTVFKQYWVAIFIYSAIIIVFTMLRLWDYKDNTSFVLLVFLFICFHLTQSMNIMRQYVSCAIIFYFTRYLEKNRILLYVTGVLLGLCFHNSAIIGIAFIPLFYLFNKTIKRRLIKLLIIFSACIPLALYVWIKLGDKYSFYLQAKEVISVGIGLIAKIVLLALFYFISIKPKRKTVKTDKLTYYVAICFVGCAISFLGYIFPFLDRLGLSFKIFEVPLYGIMVNNEYGILIKGENPKIIRRLNIYTIIIAVLTLYCIFTVFIKNGQGVFPYIPIWES